MSDNLPKVIEDSARGSFFLTTGNMIATVISAIAVFIVARLLGPDLYGVYTISLTVPSLLLLFIGFGIDAALTRFGANLHYKGENNNLLRIIRLGVTFRVIAGVAMFITCFLFSDYLAAIVISRPGYGIYIRLSSLVIIFQTILYSSSAVFVGLDKTEYSAITADIQAIVKTILAPLLVFAGFGVVGAITGFVVSCLAGGLLSAGLLIIKLYQPLKLKSTKVPQKNKESAILLRTLLNFGFPIYLSTLLIGASVQLQTIVLSFFTLDLDIGNFKAVANFIILMTTLSTSMSTALLPAFSRLEKGSIQTRTFFELATKYTSMLLLPVSILIILFSKELIQIVYGEAFSQAALILSIYFLTYFLVGLGSLVQESFFSGLGETKKTLRINLLRFVIFIGLGPFLTYIAQVQGMIVAILISNFASTLLGAYIAKVNFAARPKYGMIARIYLVSILSAIPTFLVSYSQPFNSIINLFIGTSSYFVLYITLLPITGILAAPELENLQKTTEGIRLLSHIAKPILAWMRKFTSTSEESRAQSKIR